jgi:hypothetical protein
MSYSSEGYLSHHRDNERVANMIRSITQDGCLDLQKITIDPFFPKKIVDGVDIGSICSDLIIKIAGSLQDEVYEKEFWSLQDEAYEKEFSTKERGKVVNLFKIIFIDYLAGINPNDDIVWQINWLTEGMPLFMKKINTLPGTGKVAPMASLKKPEVDKEEIHEWWKI